MRLSLLVAGLIAIPSVASAQRGDATRVLESEYLQKQLKLTKSQIERIKQIRLQKRGTRALLDEDVAKKIGLSSTKRKKIQEMFDSNRKSWGDYWKLRRSNRDEARKLYEKLSKEYRALPEKVMNELTQSQKAKFEKLKGDKFDEKQLFPRRESRPDL